MTQSDPPRVLSGAEILLAQFEEETAAIDRHRRAAEAAEIARARIEAALDALAPALPPDAARELRRRVAAASAPQAAEGRARGTAAHEAMALLAGWPRPALAVTELQTRLLERGFTLRRTYASGLLRRLAIEGVVAKTARGRYRILRNHPEILALRLAQLEAPPPASAWVAPAWVAPLRRPGP